MLGPEQPPEQKGGDGQGDHAIAEAPCHTIGQALDGRPTGLGLLHQTNDPGQGGFSTDTGDLQHQSCLQIEASRGQLRAKLCLHREGLTGEAGHINGRGPLKHHPIHRNAVSYTHLTLPTILLV